MKYLHIMHVGNRKATDSYIRFINEYFNSREHLFIIISAQTPNDGYSDISNVITMQRQKLSCIVKYIKNSRYVFLHSMFLSVTIKVYLLLNKTALNKMVWIAWGTDLYQAERGNTLKQKASYVLTEKVKHRIKTFIGIFPPDIEYFQHHYGDGAKTFYASYVGAIFDVIYKSEPVINHISEKINKDETINIMIGHQANRALNHKQVIDWISRFKDKNIHVYIPLSYGDTDEYLEGVSGYAKNKFGDKVTVLTEYMEYAEYKKLLQNIDIAIFHTKRQIGLGNICPLLYMQKKIYLDGLGVMYGYYKNQAINVCDSARLATVSWDEFVSETDMANVTQIIKEDVCIDTKFAMWNNVFANLI